MPAIRNGLAYLVLTMLLLATPASAEETVRYTYDAQGRLVKVERTGTVNNNTKAEYQLDKAGNRTRVKTTKPAGS